MCVCILALLYMYICICVHTYIYACISLYILIDVCIRIYLHTLNIGVCYEYAVAGMGTQLKCRFKGPFTARITEDMKNPEAVKESLNTCYIQKTPTVYSAYSLFSLKKENGRRKTPEISQSSRIYWKEDDLLVVRNLLR